jgi:hypothetical protein
MSPLLAHSRRGLVHCVCLLQIQSGHWSHALDWLMCKVTHSLSPGDAAMKIDGRCHCGFIAYESEADPEMTVICARLYRARRFGASCPHGKVPSSFDRVNRKYTSKQQKAGPSGNKRFVQFAGHQSFLQRSVTDQRFTAFAWALCANATNLHLNCSTGFARPNIGPTIWAPYQRLKGSANLTAMMAQSNPFEPKVRPLIGPKPT